MEVKLLTLEINRHNILSWLKLALKVYPFDKESREKIEKFLYHTDVRLVRKAIRESFPEGVDDG